MLPTLELFSPDLPSLQPPPLDLGDSPPPAKDAKKNGFRANEYQLDILKRYFQRSRSLSKDDLEEIIYDTRLSRKFILAWFSRQRLRARRLAPDDEPSPRRYDPRQRRSPVSVPASSASPSASASSSEVVIKQEYEEPSLSGIDSADSQPKKRRRIRKPPQPKTAVRAIGVQAPATKRQKTNASSRTDKPNPVDNAAAHISYPGHPGDMPSEEPTAHHPVALPVALPLAVHIPSTLSRNRSLSLSSRTSSPPSPPLPSNFVSFISPLKLTVPSLADRKLGSALRIDTNLAFDESDMLIHPPQPITAGAPLRGQRDIARKIAVSLSAAEPVPAPPPLASMVNLLSPSELDLQSNASVSPSPDVVTPAATERDDWLSTPSPGTPISLVNAAKFDHRMPVETAVPIVIGAPGTDETIDLSHIFAKDVTDSEASPTPPPTSELPDSFDLFDFTDLGSPEEAITPPEFEAEANAITIGAPLMDENIDLSHIFAQDTTVLDAETPPTSELPDCSDLFDFDFTEPGTPDEAITPPAFDTSADGVLAALLEQAQANSKGICAGLGLLSTPCDGGAEQTGIFNFALDDLTNQSEPFDAAAYLSGLGLQL